MKKLLILALMLTTSFSYAETCDELLEPGTTKGLYGLCVAYCEGVEGPDHIDDVLTDAEQQAILSDPSSIKGPLFTEKDVPAKRILEQYDRKRTESDPKMPCVKYETTCPVVTQAEVDAFGADYLADVADNGIVDGEYYIYSQNYNWRATPIWDGQFLAQRNPRPPYEVQIAIQSFQILSNGYHLAQYKNVFTGINRLQIITAEEHQACQEMIYAREAIVFPEDIFLYLCVPGGSGPNYDGKCYTSRYTP